MKKLLDKALAFIVMLLWVLAGIGGIVNCAISRQIYDKIANHDTTVVYMPNDTVYLYKWVNE